MIAFLVSFVLGPPDLISQLTLGAISAFFCCVTLLILTRLKFVKSSPNSMHTLVCILVCMVSVLSVQIWMLYKRITFHSNQFTNSIINSATGHENGPNQTGRA
jgi:membrane-anchored protein YejM (alkaline phosphatase superfamily)